MKFCCSCGSVIGKRVCKLQRPKPAKSAPVMLWRYPAAIVSCVTRLTVHLLSPLTREKPAWNVQRRWTHLVLASLVESLRRIISSPKVCFLSCLGILVIIASSLHQPLVVEKAFKMFPNKGDFEQFIRIHWWATLWLWSLVKH